jgi:benzoyl-CoA reductase subunit BamC
MCEGEDEPLCVKWCLADALIFEEREVDVDVPEVLQGEVEIGLESLINKHGIDKVADIVAQISKTSKPTKG